MTWIRLVRRLGAIVFLIALGCSSNPPKNPAAGTSEADVNAKRLQSYKEAKSHQTDAPEKACELFKALAADTGFPAREMAELRAVESCSAAQFPAYDRGHLPSWMQDQATDVMVRLAATRGDKNAEMDLAVEKSKQKLSQNEKVKWMNLAILRAEELQMPEKVEEFKTRLYKIAPRLDPEPTEKKYLSVAADWRLVRQFEKARDYYERVIKSTLYDTDDKLAALKGIRLGYKNARQNDKHLEASQRVVDFLATSLKASSRNLAKPFVVAHYDAQVYRARALWTEGKGKEASGIFDKIEKKMRGKVSLAELYWLKGRLADETHDFDKVSKYLDLALKERFNDTDLRDKVMWYGAWNERRRGNSAKAAEILEDLIAKTQTDFTRQRALFWLGQTQTALGKPDEAKANYTRLLELDPLGYYGLLAHRQLNLPITLQMAPGTVRTPASEESLQIPLDTTLADWLFLLDEKEALTSFLDLASQSYHKQRTQNDDGWVTIFKYYAKAGLYMKLYESLGTLTPDRRKSIFEHHPELLFPQPWLEDVHAASQQFGVDEELIYAITRQESAFDTHARSLADAFGLMQLLPEVAEQLSEKYKIPYTGMEDLYDPKTNINFGAAHLKELFQRQHGQFILAVASYNASENVIRNWMKSRFHGDALEFIEEIPYEETRAYVRLVMRNLIFYSLLKSKSASIAFPDQVLKLDGAETGA